MCTYSQLKKNTKKNLCSPLCPKIVRVQRKRYLKCIEGGSMKLATQLDYVYM